MGKSQTTDRVYILIHKMRDLVCVLSEVWPSSKHFVVLGTESKADLLFLNTPSLDQNFVFILLCYTWFWTSFLLGPFSSSVPSALTCFLAPLNPLYFLMFFTEPPVYTTGLQFSISMSVYSYLRLGSYLKLSPWVPPRAPWDPLSFIPPTEAHLSPKPKDQVFSGSGDKPAVKLQILFPERPHYSVSGDRLPAVPCPYLAAPHKVRTTRITTSSTSAHLETWL